MAARIGDDLQPLEASAIGEGERLVEDDHLARARARLGGLGATGGGVFAASSPPLQRIFAVGRRQQIENRFGAIALIWPHRFFHILVAEDVALGVARIVSDEADGGPDLALTGGDADLFHGGVIDAHADKRGAQHF